MRTSERCCGGPRERGDGELSLRLAGALVDFWLASGHLREGRRWLEHALALNSDGPPQLRAKALVGAGTFVGLMGDFPTARKLLQHAMELAVGNPAATARALTRLGMLATNEDDARGAEVLLERSLALCRECQDLRWQALTLVQLGVARTRLGDLDRAEATFAESLDLCHIVGTKRVAVTISSLSRPHQAQAAG